MSRMLSQRRLPSFCDTMRHPMDVLLRDAVPEILGLHPPRRRDDRGVAPEQRQAPALEPVVTQHADGPETTAPEREVMQQARPAEPAIIRTGNWALKPLGAAYARAVAPMGEERRRRER